MIKVEIPGYHDGRLELEHLVLDFNGTIAVDGKLIDGVAERITTLAEHLEVHVVTADTFGRAREELEGLPCSVDVLLPEAQDLAKAKFVEQLGPDRTVSIGNGRNDHTMLEHSALGIAVILGEGAARAAVYAANVVATDINVALDLLVNPKRLLATLRR